MYHHKSISHLSKSQISDELRNLKIFLNSAPSEMNPSNPFRTHNLPNDTSITCVLWNGIFHITGADIVKALLFRFQAFGRQIENFRKFEEGVFSDLRQLKPGVDASLEEARSEFLNLLVKLRATRTMKKQKVFYFFSVCHDKLFSDAIERDLKRESIGASPCTSPLDTTSIEETYRLLALECQPLVGGFRTDKLTELPSYLNYYINWIAPNSIPAPIRKTPKIKFLKPDPTSLSVGSSKFLSASPSLSSVINGDITQMSSTNMFSISSLFDGQISPTSMPSILIEDIDYDQLEYTKQFKRPDHMNRHKRNHISPYDTPRRVSIRSTPSLASLSSPLMISSSLEPFTHDQSEFEQAFFDGNSFMSPFMNNLSFTGTPTLATDKQIDTLLGISELGNNSKDYEKFLCNKNVDTLDISFLDKMLEGDLFNAGSNSRFDEISGFRPWVDKEILF